MSRDIENVILVSRDAAVVVIERESGDIVRVLEEGTHSIDQSLYDVEVYLLTQQEVRLAGSPETSTPGFEAVQFASEDNETIFADVSLLYSLNPLMLDVFHQNWDPHIWKIISYLQ